MILGGMILSTSSCVNTKKIAYFHDVGDTTFYSSEKEDLNPIEPNNILSITITSANRDADEAYNLQSNTVRRATTLTGSNTESGGYLVNPDGTIDMPGLGTIKAAGLTKKQLKDHLTHELLSRKLLIDPVVDVRFLNFEVTVIGEVGRPTVITVPNEKISLLKALGIAGDLTIFGKRENILLVREENGNKITRRIDLNSPDFFNSPYYYLKPNDIIYVEPNKNRATVAVRNPNTLPIIFSVLSLTTIVIDRLLRIRY